MALGSTQSLTEISTRNIFLGAGGVKYGWSVGLTTLPLSCVDCPDNWEPQGLGIIRTVQAYSGITLPFLPTSLAALHQVILNEGRIMMIYLSSLQTVMC
jgi:hypothetical protein